MLLAIGKTYSVKEDLKSCGMIWNKEENRFECTKVDFDFDRWNNKMCDLSWNGRKQGRLCAEIKIVEEK